MREKLLHIAAFAFAAVLVTSCGSYKRLGYLQDMKPGVDYEMPAQPDAIIAKGDKISISVYCSTPALAAPFNIVTGVAAVDPVSSVASGTAEVKDAATTGNEYLVSTSGDIIFPVFGSIHVEGQTLDWVKEYLETQLVEKKYIKDPVVTVGFTNFKYTLIGEVQSGVHFVPDGRINIFDAFAEAGEPLETGMRKEVCVIRTVDGKRKLYTIDLTSKDCFYSPVYYLQQNDMVYVKPLKNKHDAVVTQRLDDVKTASSVLSTIINTFLWFRIYFTK